jgi:serine protease AprX
VKPLMSTWLPFAPRVAKVALIASLAMAASAPARAQHHARLSADLTDHLNAGSQQVEVIVDGTAAADRLAARYNLKVARRLKSGSVLIVNAGQLSALQNDADVDKLSGNVRYKTSSIDPIDEGIGADQVWAGAGPLPKLSGRGVTVALIDSGIDPTHNALKGHVLATVDFTGGDGVDHFGHGTHVAAIIEGNPGQTADTSMYRGVAYGASLVNLRALGNDGSGSAANVIEAIDWAIDHARDYNIRIINLSLGGPVLQPYRDDPVCAAVERAVRAGILVVAAAGNHGETADGSRKIIGAITSPGNSPYALTVGALDTKGTADRGDDEVAAFSSSGPTAFDQVLKPDLVAPGRRITSAEAAGSFLSVNFPLQHVAGSGSNSYIYGSGTSMATAVVSGAAALLLEERQNLQPLGVKAALQMTAEFLPAAGLIHGGAGSLNVVAAADFAQNGDLGNTTISGDSIAPSHLVIASADQIVSAQSFDSSRRLALTPLGRTKGKSAAQKAASDTLVWGNGDTLVWGNGDTLVWGNGDTLVWGNSATLVWGNTATPVWGNSDTLVWGN